MDVNSVNIIKDSQRRPEATNTVAKKKTDKQQEVPESSKENSVVTKNELNEAVDNSNEIGQLLKRKLNFAIDENRDKVIVTVVDEESGEVVRQVPPKEMLRISAHLQKLKDMNDQVMHAVKSVILDVTA